MKSIMKPITSPQQFKEESRLLVINSEDVVKHDTVKALQEYFQPGDLLIVNQSGTLPSSFQGKVESSQKPVEIRLAEFLGPSVTAPTDWWAIAFGSGSWRDATEDRGPVPEIQVGDKIIFSESLIATVKFVEDSKLLKIEFKSETLVHDLYRSGKPIQYSYHQKEIEVWDQQTIFSGAPISVEPPSASFPMSWKIISHLMRSKIQVAGILHSAGISSSGNPELDKKLPLDEWYQLPIETITAIEETKNRGGKVIALGTSVLRAVESGMARYQLDQNSGSGVTGMATLKVSSKSDIQVIDSLVTGLHDPAELH